MGQSPSQSPVTMFSKPLLLLLLPLLVTGAPSPSSSSDSSSGSSTSGLALAAAGVAGVAAGIALAPNPDCEDVGIDRTMCAVLYDKERCDRSHSFLNVAPGGEGVLPILTRGLRRNDVESLLVRRRCKLELWDRAEGFEQGTAPDLVIDRTPWYVVSNKYIDELDDDYEEMNEAISAYRCSCRDSYWG